MWQVQTTPHLINNTQPARRETRKQLYSAAIAELSAFITELQAQHIEWALIFLVRTKIKFRIPCL